MLIDGKPAVMIDDGLDTTAPIARIYRFDGQSWSLFACHPLPIGASSFRTVTCHGGQKSYLVATTCMGKEHIYAVDGQGIHATAAKPRSQFPIPPLYIEVLMLASTPTFLLIYAFPFGGGIWLLMWWYTTRHYEFGNQSVKLASLGRRSLARLIDMGLVISGTILLGWIMTQGLDWDSLAEAYARGADHPTLHAAKQVAFKLGLWLLVSTISITVMQGIWGITPGKWCCGLRAFRTTLRPCGITRSVLREIVLILDSGYFFCWAPGICSIALTANRQRLGDLLADTIVVET